MGVKTCSTGCAKNDDLNESSVSAKRRKSKKAARPMTIEATASMMLKKENEDISLNNLNKMDPNG